ncbi:hypothetical protein IU443_29395 [Nocardia farcinica]|nr:hypothetical protein DXT66_26185 [Nocardia farcinica]MBF6394049.1 hypothetical protein [Nocardia farcinica]MBF6538206.1 hypothetical protein [Nocardia farcinica]
MDRIACGNGLWAATSVAAAHHAMQVHLDCVVGECRAKTAAHRLLVEEGLLVPDSGRVRS